MNRLFTLPASVWCRTLVAPVALSLLLAGCTGGGLSLPGLRDAAPAHAAGTPVAVQTPDAETPRAPSRPGEAEGTGDTSLTATGMLGTTIASLGSPADPGLWLLTPLVETPRPGRVRVLASGTELRLELRPSGGVPGSGSQLSMAAYQGLGLPLTTLPELAVIAD